MTILTRGRHKQRPFAFWTYVFNSEPVCGSTRKPAVHNFYEFSVKGLFCPVFSSFRWHEHLTTGCRTTLLPAGMARFCTRTPPSFPSPGGAYGSGVHGPTRRWNLKREKLTLNWTSLSVSLVSGSLSNCTVVYPPASVAVVRTKLFALSFDGFVVEVLQ